MALIASTLVFYCAGFAACALRTYVSPVLVERSTHTPSPTLMNTATLSPTRAKDTPRPSISPTRNLTPTRTKTFALSATPTSGTRTPTAGCHDDCFGDANVFCYADQLAYPDAHAHSAALGHTVHSHAFATDDSHRCGGDPYCAERYIYLHPGTADADAHAGAGYSDGYAASDQYSATAASDQYSATAGNGHPACSPADSDLAQVNATASIVGVGPSPIPCDVERSL